MACNSTVQYIRLRNLRSNDSTSAADEAQDEDNHAEEKDQKQVSIRRRFSPKKAIFLLSLALNVIGGWKLSVSSTLRDHSLTYCKPSYPAQYCQPLIAPAAPALTAVETERVVFSSAFGIERPPFQGEPSEENDRLWAGLYDCK